jgi:hypothetical protein
MAEETKDEKKPKVIDRKYIEKGTGRQNKIVRVFFDPRSNCVIDEYEVTRTFKDSEKKTVRITTLRRAYSQDAELQKKHGIRRNDVVKEL